MPHPLIASLDSGTSKLGERIVALGKVIDAQEASTVKECRDLCDEPKVMAAVVNVKVVKVQVWAVLDKLEALVKSFEASKYSEVFTAPKPNQDRRLCKNHCEEMRKTITGHAFDSVNIELTLGKWSKDTTDEFVADLATSGVIVKTYNSDMLSKYLDRCLAVLPK